MRRVPNCVFACLCVATSALAFDAARELPATGSIQVAFSPNGGAAHLIIDAIDQAQSQILVQAYSFTSKDIARALVRAQLRGVAVQVIADAEQTTRTERQVLTLLRREGVAVALDAQHSAAHNKVMLIDASSRAPVLITGSYNFTVAAEHHNAENLLVIRGNLALTRAFAEEWQTHRAHASAFLLH